uniref:Uncharacterized protein n=1 Tax=Desertifilum tharense IPPAS B-1220 TaxID=1781255 RepID=A0ACD5GZG7_9CYAN
MKYQRLERISGLERVPAGFGGVSGEVAIAPSPLEIGKTLE